MICHNVSEIIYDRGAQSKLYKQIMITGVRCRIESTLDLDLNSHL